LRRRVAILLIDPFVSLCRRVAHAGDTKLAPVLSSHIALIRTLGKAPTSRHFDCANRPPKKQTDRLQKASKRSVLEQPNCQPAQPPALQHCTCSHQATSNQTTKQTLPHRSKQTSKHLAAATWSRRQQKQGSKRHLCQQVNSLQSRNFTGTSLFVVASSQSTYILNSRSDQTGFRVTPWRKLFPAAAMKPFAQAVGEMRALGLDGDAPTVESAPSAVRYQLGDDPDSNPLVYADASCFGPSPGESVL
jgi:hypothetical protein